MSKLKHVTSPAPPTHSITEKTQMTDKKIWFITGASRGIGGDSAGMRKLMDVASPAPPTPWITERTQMTDKKIWFITGGGGGMGADFAKAVLAAGQALVATGRDPGVLVKLLGPSDDLLAVKL